MWLQGDSKTDRQLEGEPDDPLTPTTAQFGPKLFHRRLITCLGRQVRLKYVLNIVAILSHWRHQCEHHRGKYHVTTDLLLDWLRFNQTSKADANLT